MEDQEQIKVVAKDKFKIRKGMSTPIMSDLLKIKRDSSQLTFTCSKSTIETPEKGVEYFQS